jgi:phage baseplate assembly protein W
MSNLQGISVKIPLIYGQEDGPYTLNKTMQEVAHQNLKNLLLTSPGERVMIPNFGVGLHKLLFSPKSSNLFDDASTKIYNQVMTWLPYISLSNVTFVTSEDTDTLAENEIQINITYGLDGVSPSEQFTIIIDNN